MAGRRERVLVRALLQAWRAGGQEFQRRCSALLSASWRELATSNADSLQQQVPPPPARCSSIACVPELSHLH